MSSIDPIYIASPERHPITGAKLSAGYSDAGWFTGFEGDLWLSVTNADGIPGTFSIPQSKVLTWTDLNDTIDHIKGFGVDFSQNPGGALKLLRGYFKSIGHPNYYRIRAPEDRVQDSFAGVAEQAPLNFAGETPMMDITTRFLNAYFGERLVKKTLHL